MNAQHPWIVFFPMGSELGKYFCRLNASSRQYAETKAWKRYPTSVIRIVPDDERARANITLYGKKEIEFGTVLKLTKPEVDDEPMGGD